MRSRYSVIYQEVLERLILARVRAGMTQTEAAKQLGVPQSRISRIETGERRIDVAEMVELAKLYDVPVQELLGLE